MILTIYEEAIQMIESKNLNPLEVYKLIEKDFYLSRLFLFKGDRVKYSKTEYEKLKSEIHNKK